VQLAYQLNEQLAYKQGTVSLPALNTKRASRIQLVYQQVQQGTAGLPTGLYRVQLAVTDKGFSKQNFLTMAKCLFSGSCLLSPDSIFWLRMSRSPPGIFRSRTSLLKTLTKFIIIFPIML
jgi:hypothetical protein